MGINETVLMVAVGIVFCTIVVFGAFTAHVATLWAKNKKDERKAEKIMRELRNQDLFEKERGNWIGLVEHQRDQIDKLNAQLLEITRNYNINKSLLAQAERRSK